MSDLKYWETVETYYEVTSSNKEYMEKIKDRIHCHNIADIYIGTIKTKVQEPIEVDTFIEWYYPKELIGKMKLDFQNIILKKIIDKLVF